MARAQEFDEAAFARHPAVPDVAGDRRARLHELVAALRVALRWRRLDEDRFHGPLRRAAERPGAPHLVEALHLVGPGQPLDLVAVVGRQDPPLAALEPFVAWRQVDRDAARAAVEQHVGVRRLETRQVVRGVRLPGQREPVRQRGPLGDGDGLRSNAIEDARPSRAELLGREIGLVDLRKQRRRERHTGTDGESERTHTGHDRLLD